jgi:hypothetical protein
MGGDLKEGRSAEFLEIAGGGLAAFGAPLGSRDDCLSRDPIKTLLICRAF